MKVSPVCSFENFIPLYSLPNNTKHQTQWEQRSFYVTKMCRSKDTLCSRYNLTGETYVQNFLKSVT